MSEKPRVYGTADEADRDPPAAQGLRGENRADVKRGYSHDVTLGDGRTVTVAQDSGVAYAEATGAAGRDASEEIEIEFTPEKTPDWRWPALFFGLIGIAAGLYLADRRRRARGDYGFLESRAEPAGDDADGLYLANRHVGHQSPDRSV